MSRRSGPLAILAIALLGTSTVPAAPHDPDGRLKQLDALIAKRPGDGNLYLRRGELHHHAGHLRLALRDFDRAQTLRPDLTGVHLARAMTLVAAGRRELALSSVRRFLSTAPQHGFAKLTEARTLFDLGRTRESAIAFDRALALLPRITPEHVLEQARVHAQQGATGVQHAIDRLRAGVRLLGPIVALTRYGRRLGAALEQVRRIPAAAGAASRQPAVPPAVPPPATFAGESVLVPLGASWRYLDDGSNQGTAWRGPRFDDSGWKSGPAQLGYGDGDEKTVVGYGPNANARHITTWFRHSFQVPAGTLIQRARLRLVRDDGAVIYLNGTEIARANMPAGAITHTTLASSDIDIIGEQEIHTIYFDHRLLQDGANVVAVEIHQVKPDSDDISMDLELRASDGVPAVERGPYLQMGTDRSAIIRWRTDYPTGTVAFLGSSPTNLQARVQSTTPTTEHTAVLTGLAADTRYHYAVGNQAGILAGGTDFHFRTSPAPGTAKKTRLWVLGDSGTADTNAAAVRDSYLNHARNAPADLLLMLGDNAYFFGTDTEYQRAVFDMYPSILRNTFLWPTIGNHEVYTSRAATSSGPYYDIFDLPKNGEAGGLASGTEAYYSFDYGDIHFVCLNSADDVRLPAAPMMTWLEADLKATQARWVIAFWHHPPYSKGSHDTDKLNEVESIDMRQWALPILEAAGVDLVLTGHSHSYERSYLLDGHYSFSNNLRPDMVVDRGDGQENSHGIYTKRTRRRGAHEGAVYVVNGCSGYVSPGPLNHSAMLVSLAQLGSLVIDVDGDRLDVRFLASTGRIEDSFTIQKGVVRTLTRDAPAISLTTGGVQRLSLDAGNGQANRFYRIAGSLDTTPGFRLDGVQVPLEVDVWFEMTLTFGNTSVLQNTLGVLDFQGRAEARIAIPPLNAPAAIGLRLHHAYVAYDLARVHMASNPVSLTLVK